MDTQLFHITGLHCEACIKLTAKRIQSVPGVADAVVELQSGKAQVIANRQISLAEINTALEGSDYHAEEYHE